MFFKVQTIHKREEPKRKPGMTAGINALLLHRFILQIGVGLFGLFTPIYIYEICGRRLAAPLITSILFYGLSFFLMPLAARFVTRWGMKRSLIIGTLFFSLYYFLLALRGAIPLWALISSSLLVSACYHVIYWLPYHVELMGLTTAKKRGRALGYFAALTSVVGIVTPLIAGFSIATFGYLGIILTSFLFLLSSIPALIPLKTIKERYSFGFFESFQILFERKNRLLFCVYAIEGAENIVGSLFWPLFLFQFFQGNYVAIGMNAALVVAIGTILELGMGFLVEKQDNKPLLQAGVGLSAFGWVLKALITTISQVIFASVFHTFALIIERIPFQALMYTRAADAGHYVDEYTVLREMALCAGRVAMILICWVLLSVVGFMGAFILAALVTLGFTLITRLRTNAPGLSLR